MYKVNDARGVQRGNRNTTPYAGVQMGGVRATYRAGSGSNPSDVAHLLAVRGAKPLLATHKDPPGGFVIQAK